MMIIDNKSMVKTLKEIREKLSVEIMDMTFEEERIFLDKLLKKNAFPPNANKINTPI